MNSIATIRIFSVNRIARAVAVLAITGSAVCVVAPAWGDEIVLKASVRAPADAREVRLADIATLTGPAAEALADCVILTLDDPAALHELQVRDVRDRLDAADANWGRINLTGRRVVIRPRIDLGSSVPAAMRPVRLTDPKSDRSVQERPASDPKSDDGVPATELVGQATLRGAIAELLVRQLRIVPEKLRLLFADRDRELLELSMHDLRFQIDPISSVMTDRVELVVKVWSQGRIVRTETLAVLPMMLVRRTLLAHDVSRGTQLSASDLREEPVWLSPGQARGAVTRIEAAGRIATRRLKAETPLRPHDLRREVVVKRGDPLTVDCLSGGVVISFLADAAEDGSIGDRIEIRKRGERQTILATIEGPGRAIIRIGR